MNAPSRRPDVDAITQAALRREAETRLAAGERLSDGEWLPRAEARRARRARGWRALQGTIEALVFWAVIGLGGLVCLVLVTEVL